MTRSRAVPQSPKPGVPGGGAAVSRDPRAARSLSGEPPRLGGGAPRQARWSQERAGPDPSIDYLEAPAGPRARTLWETTAKRLGRWRRGRAQPAAPSHVDSRAGQHLGDAARPHMTVSRRPGSSSASAIPTRSSALPTRPMPPARAPLRRARRGFRDHGEDCTFETLVKRFGSRTGGSSSSRRSSRGGPADGKFTETSRRVWISRSCARRGHADDHDLLERGMASSTASKRLEAEEERSRGGRDATRQGFRV